MASGVADSVGVAGLLSSESSGFGRFRTSSVPDFSATGFAGISSPGLIAITSCMIFLLLSLFVLESEFGWCCHAGVWVCETVPTTLATCKFETTLFSQDFVSLAGSHMAEHDSKPLVSDFYLTTFCRPAVRFEADRDHPLHARMHGTR